MDNMFYTFIWMKKLPEPTKTIKYKELSQLLDSK